MLNRVLDAVKGVFEEPPSLIERGVFKALGDGYWYAAFTNNLQDRDKEILSADAHERYVKRVKAGLTPLPELWVWHVVGSKAGQALAVDRLEHVVYAVGKFDDSEAGRNMEAYVTNAKNSNDGLSHGFTYPAAWAFVDGVYLDYNTFEISVLPRGKAANPYTSFEGVFEMPITEEQRLYLEQVVGKDVADRVAKRAEGDDSRAKALADAGVAYKEKFSDYADLTGSSNEAEAATEAATKAFAQTLNLLIEEQDKQAGVLQDVLDGTKARDAAIEAHKQALDVAVEAFNVASKQLQEYLAEQKALTPRRVDADENNTVNDEAGEKIIKEMNKPAEGDPIFMGLDKE